MQANFSLKRFYARRALRILPVFFVVFAVNTWVLAGYLPSVFVNGRRFTHLAFGLWPYATFWGNYVELVAGWLHRPVGGPGRAYHVYWSLCVEEHFYLLWPLLLSSVKARRTLFSAPRPATLRNFLLGYALFGALSVMAGTVLHLLVEKPFLRLRDRFRAA